MQKKITPMLATLIEKPFDKEGWLFEVKWDGYRALAYKNRNVHLLSRNHKSFNSRFPHIVCALQKLSGHFILDGEIVILDNKGKSHFQLLQNNQKSQTTPMYYIFDILNLDGQDLRLLPLIERKKILKKFLPKKSLLLRCGDYIPTQGIAFFKEAKKKGLEGIIAKNEQSTYQSRRSKDWLKIKTGLRQEVVIGGFTEPKGSRKYFGALLVGVYKRGQLICVGHVGSGFDENLLSNLYARLKKIISVRCPFSIPPRPNAEATWVKPKLVCEVSFAEWTQEGSLRQPIFKGLRIDKKPTDVIREVPKTRN